MAKRQTTIESELKYRLEREQYRKLLRIFKPRLLKYQYQRNTYFDSPDLALRKHKCALRIRITNHRRAELTVKYPETRFRKGPRNLKVRRELNASLSLTKAQALVEGRAPISEMKLQPLRELRRRLSPGPLPPLRPLGSTWTHRHTIEMEKNLRIELDHFRIFQAHYYELEAETERPDWTHERIRQILKAHSIPFRPLRVSKIAHFLQAWNERRTALRS